MGTLTFLTLEARYLNPNSVRQLLLEARINVNEVLGRTT